ncbi:MAG: class I SAM-dependent rRNA methyltransferase [Flavobacteriaceae bacterium]|nr:class I SAM-dependent rRNA methyltransferase [Flavobacteriaceae bacterium]
MAVKLTTIGERSVRSGHPWIFTDSIEKINKEGTSGDIAIIFSHTKNKVIGVGLYDPDSPIRIKILHHDGGAKLDIDFFSNKIKKAFAIRVPLLATDTNSYRLIFGENDHFPGLIADVYNKVLVVKLYTAIWFPYLEIILKQLIEVSQSKTVVLRLSRSLQQIKNTYGFSEGQVIFGTLTNEVIPFVEHGVNFLANVIKGHKTGYFLDHRDNRKRVGALSKNKTVLDVFSYAGGFSVHALVNQAKAVTSLDISKQALALAIENGKLNSFRGTHNTLAGDAFEILRELISKRQIFDIVVIDPPSFAKSKVEIEIAKKKYRLLAELGVQLTAMGGMLVLASCSSRIVADSFFQINKEVLDHQSRPYVLQNKTQHDVDHPISFKEGAYLKTGFYRFL